MVGYTKLFSDILASSIWDEPDTVRIVWITMLAMADRDGIVGAAIPGLAHLARVSREDCEKALTILLEPDPHSRTKDQDGRRIEVVDGGWRIINYEKHRERTSPEEVKEKAARRQKRWRDRRNAALRSVTSNESNDIAEADAEAEGRKEGRTEPPPDPEPEPGRHGESRPDPDPPDLLRRKRELRDHLLSLGVLRRARGRLDALVHKMVTEQNWDPGLVDEVLGGIRGETEQDRAAQLASFLLNDQERREYADDACRRAWEAKTRNRA